MWREVGRAREPGEHRAPAEPEQRARRDVFADACAARAALVGRGSRERRNLHEVEVVEQPDPGDAREHVQPDDQAGHVEVR